MGTKSKQYELYRYFELTRLRDIFMDNIEYYNKDTNWDRYLNGIRNIAKDETEHTLEQKQTHLLNQTHKNLDDMFAIHKDVTIEFIRMFYSELFENIVKLSPENALQYMQKELTLIDGI
jgi:hypothetical protein